MSSAKSFFIPLVLALGVWSNANAEAPTIGGDVNIAVETDEVTNAAEGDDSSAQVIIGSFMGAASDGDLDITVSTAAISNMAEGDGACNQVVIGSVVGTVGCLGEN